MSYRYIWRSSGRKIIETHNNKRSYGVITAVAWDLDKIVHYTWNPPVFGCLYKCAILLFRSPTTSNIQFKLHIFSTWYSIITSHYHHYTRPIQIGKHDYNVKYKNYYYWKSLHLYKLHGFYNISEKYLLEFKNKIKCMHVFKIRSTIGNLTKITNILRHIEFYGDWINRVQKTMHNTTKNRFQ